MLFGGKIKQDKTAQPKFCMRKLVQELKVARPKFKPES